jgi:GT2 family glycosyltransferase
MKLSVVILCWNDLKVIGDCLRSIFTETDSTEFEVIVSDNGSTDGSIEFIRENYPQVRLIENGRNLRFAKANNVGIRASRGEYVLIMNPDTVIHEDALDTMVKFAEAHPEAGAVGCRVLNSDGSNQESARPLPSIRSAWIAALYLKPLGYLSDWFHPGIYVGWKGETQRSVGWLSGCFILLRGDLLRRLGGFDEQFFYYCEDKDLCHRVGEAGYSVIYTPEATITHLGGQSTQGRFPALTFALDSEVTHYLYYYKYGGKRGARRWRRVSLVSLLVRRLGYGLLQFLKPTEIRKRRLELLGSLFAWNYRVDPVRLVENGEEPELSTALVGRVRER